MCKGWNINGLWLLFCANTNPCAYLCFVQDNNEKKEDKNKKKDDKDKKEKEKEPAGPDLSQQQGKNNVMDVCK